MQKHVSSVCHVVLGARRRGEMSIIHLFNKTQEPWNSGVDKHQLTIKTGHQTRGKPRLKYTGEHMRRT